MQAEDAIQFYFFAIFICGTKPSRSSLIIVFFPLHESIVVFVVLCVFHFLSANKNCRLTISEFGDKVKTRDGKKIAYFKVMLMFS